MVDELIRAVECRPETFTLYMINERPFKLVDNTLQLRWWVANRIYGLHLETDNANRIDFCRYDKSRAWRAYKRWTKWKNQPPPVTPLEVLLIKMRDTNDLASHCEDKS